MYRVGVLLHVYNLNCLDWEQLVWGNPERDELGAGAKLFEYMLTEPVSTELKVVLCNGPSSKNGLPEGEYTRKFLVDHLNELAAFPRIHKLLAQHSPAEHKTFLERVANIQIGEPIRNTYEEIVQSARLFHAYGANKVVHVAASSHAPRCIQLQSMAHEKGIIPREQQWFTVASDVPFAGTSARDTVVIEVPHRADDPLFGYQPTLAGIIKPYFSLSGDQQRRFILKAQAAMADIQSRAGGKTQEQNQPSLSEAV